MNPVVSLGGSMIIGIAFCVFGLIHGVTKYFVIRSAARDIYNGGGVPVMDFVVFVPLWLSFGSTRILKHANCYPFPFFGLAAYFVLAAVFYGLMELEYHLGKPEVERQLMMIKAKDRGDRNVAANDGATPPVDDQEFTEGPPSVI